MGRQDAVEHIMASLHDAMLDHSRWPAVAAPHRRGLRPDRQRFPGRRGPEGRPPGSLRRGYCRGQRRQAEPVRLVLSLSEFG